MNDDAVLKAWFMREVLPLERSLLAFIARNWTVADDVPDLLQDVYAQVIASARLRVPTHSKGYVFTVTRNHLINRAKRAKIVLFEHIADLESTTLSEAVFEAEQQLAARDALRHVQAGLDKLSPRVRQIVLLRKVHGLNVQETSEQLGIGKDAVNHQLGMGMRALTDHMLGGTGKIIRRRYVAARSRQDKA